MINSIILGNCQEILREMPGDFVDSIVTDPPYGLKFMGKKWDYDVPSVEIWQEALRVLKPGGHLLSFGGTRTYHRMVCGIEDAGFEIMPMCGWLYGSGFPKSHNVGKAINSLETKEWSKIYKALDNIDKNAILDIWKINSKDVRFVEKQSQKNQIIVGQDMQSENFVQAFVVENIKQIKSDVNAIIAESCFGGHQAKDSKINIVQKNVEASTKQLPNLVKSVEKLSQDQNHNLFMLISIVQENVKELLKEKTMVNRKVEEALKTLRGNQKYSEEVVINALYAVLTENLKLIILNQSKTFQSLDTISQMECVSAINVTITESIAVCLITNMVNIAKEIASQELQGNERKIVGKKDGTYADIKRDKKTGQDGLHGGVATQRPRVEVFETKGNSQWEGFGTALKPAMEPICMARKPIEKGLTIAGNCLKHGTGGINIDGCRVNLNGEKAPTGSAKRVYAKNQYTEDKIYGDNKETSPLGRFPANLILDDSECVKALFPDTQPSKGGYVRKTGKEQFLGQMSDGKTNSPDGLCDSGSAARFFYVAKPSKAEKGSFNKHPTCKPLTLMKYLLRLITPPNGITLDPFCGSGTSCVAAVEEGFKYIGIEQDEESVKTANQRITQAQPSLF